MCRKGSSCMTMPGTRACRQQTRRRAALRPRAGCDFDRSNGCRQGASLLPYLRFSRTRLDICDHYDDNSRFTAVLGWELHRSAERGCRTSGAPDSPVGRVHRGAALHLPRIRRQRRGAVAVWIKPTAAAELSPWPASRTHFDATERHSALLRLQGGPCRVAGTHRLLGASYCRADAVNATDAEPLGQ